MSEAIAATGAYFDLPPVLLEANLQANRVYPQNQTALSMQAGYVAYRLLMEGQLTPRQLFECKATDAQQQKMLDAAARAHRGNGIPCTLVDNKDYDNPHQFTRERIAALSTGWLTVVQSQIATFAANTVPEIDPIPYNILTMVGKKSRDVMEAEEFAVNMFLPRDGQTPRPEALALDGLWRAGHDILAEPEALEIGRRARSLMRELLQPDFTTEEWNELEAELRRQGNSLKLLVKNHVLDTIPAVSERTGVPLAATTVEAFLQRGISGFSIHKPHHLAKETAERQVGRSKATSHA